MTCGLLSFFYLEVSKIFFKLLFFEKCATSTNNFGPRWTEVTEQIFVHILNDCYMIKVHKKWKKKKI